jgi:hypothetical protein
MPTANSPVVVNLNVSIDTSGNLNVFGQDVSGVSNVIVAEQPLPANSLYADASSSLIEFWEPTTDLGTRKATLSGKADAGGVAPITGNDYKAFSKKIVYNLQQVLQGAFDCSGAVPFNEYTSTEAYYKPGNFGRLALSAYAHYLFGHVAATAAITNDKAFIQAMLSQDSNDAYKYATEADVAGNTDGTEWLNIGSATDADIARLIAGQILTKNDAAILAITEQVLGQDASRAMDKDNNALTPGVRQALKFIPYDTIYVNIKLVTPTVVIGSEDQQVSDTTLEGKYPNSSSADINYTVKIVLS